MMYCVNCDNHVTVDDKTARKCPNCGKDPDRESPKTIDEALKSLKPRRSGDYRLYEEEIRPLITIERKISIVEEYCCPHWIQPSGKYEIGHIRLTEPHPILGEQTRRIAMCCDCYQILRKAGVAPLPGTWEDKK